MLFLQHLRFCAAPPTAGDPSGFLPFSSRVCLPYCCAGGVGWGCRPSLVFSVLLLHRLACRCSLGSAPCVRVLPLRLWLLFVWQCGGALWLPEPLGLCWLFCHPLLRFSAFVGAVLCSLFGFPCFRVGALLACGVCSASWLRGFCSLGCPSWLVLLLMFLFVLHLLLRVRLFGHSLLAPPAAPVCCALVGSLMRHCVTLAYCRVLSFCCFSPGFLPLAFVQAWVGRLRSCLGSSLLFFGGWGWGVGGLSFPCPCCFRLAVPPVLLSKLLEFS